jgi:hypothetical protein
MTPEQLRQLAIKTLVEIAGDRQAGGGARTLAAKTLLQLGEINAFAPVRVEDEAVSVDPLELEAKLKEKLARLLGRSGDAE